MQSVNMLQAKSNLSRLVASIENGTEEEVIISRNSRPVVRLVPVAEVILEHRIGVAKGRFVTPANIDASNEQVAALFSCQV